MAYSKVILNGTTIMDVTQDTVNASNLLSGETATRKDGVSIIGEATGGTLITKVITENGTYSAEDDDADGYSEVTVNVSRGVEEAELNDVNFYDYDGTRLYSYSASDFLNSTELPQNPNHDGLIFYAWNWSLADAKEYVAKYGILEIGATYKTSDGTTRFYFDIYNSFVLTIAIRCKPSVSNGVTIDWGDGTTSTVSRTSYSNVSHTYSSIGKYVAKVAVTNGTVSFGGGSGTYIIGSVGNNYKRKLSTVKRIEFGDNVILETHVFNSLPNLDAIVLPWNLTSLGNYSFDTMYPIKGIVFPSGFTSIGATNNIIFLLGIACLPKSLNNGNVTITGQTVRAISMPEGCFVRSTNASIGIQKIIIPDGVTTITANAYRYAHNARYIEIGKDVTSIEATSFMEAPASEIHLKPTTPPNLANANVFASWLQDIAVFYVPYSEDHSVLEAYKTATNWSTWSTRFQEEPQ